MARFLNVFNDLRLNCGATEGNEAGRYVLEDAEIDYGGVSHGITLYVQKIYIFEDIDKYGITGWIEMIDVDNIVSGYISGGSGISPSVILGQELLKLKFKTIGSDFSVDFTDHPLHIHKIENLRTYDPGTGAEGAGAIQYRIHFCAPELMNNDRIRVSQSYCDTYSEIVKDILKNHLKTSKDVWLEETKDIHNVVIPNMHPFDAIRWIARQCRSKSASNIPNYNFYETTKGYRFKTMHAQAVRHSERRQMDGKDQQMAYSIPTGRINRNYLGEMMTATSYKFIRTGDTYEAIQKGMFASKSIQHDSYHKNYSIKATNYDRKYAPDIEALPARGFIGERHIPSGGGTVFVPDGTKYESQHPLIEGNSESFTEFPDSRIFFTSTGSKHAYDFADKDGVRTKDNNTDQLTTPLWHMQQSHDRYMQLMLSVWGVSGLQVGDMIALDAPVIGSDRSPGKQYDYRWSGAYYITKLVHRIDLSADVAEYHCDLVCSAKDAASTPLPKNGNLAGKDTKTGSIKDFSGRKER